MQGEAEAEAIVVVAAIEPAVIEGQVQGHLATDIATTGVHTVLTL